MLIYPLNFLYLGQFQRNGLDRLRSELIIHNFPVTISRTNNQTIYHNSRILSLPRSMKLSLFKDPIMTHNVSLTQVSVLAYELYINYAVFISAVEGCWGWELLDHVM